MKKEFLIGADTYTDLDAVSNFAPNNIFFIDQLKFIRNELI